MGANAILPVLLFFAMVYLAALILVARDRAFPRQNRDVPVHRVPQNLQNVAGRWYAPFVFVLWLLLVIPAIAIYLIVFLPVFVWKAAAAITRRMPSARHG